MRKAEEEKDGHREREILGGGERMAERDRERKKELMARSVLPIIVIR